MVVVQTIGVPAGTAPKVLGSAYYAVTKGSPPNASRLAAVLEEFELFIPVKYGIGLHWKLNFELLQPFICNHLPDVSTLLLRGFS